MLLASDFYQDHLRNVDIFHWCGILLEPVPTQRLLVAAQRRFDAGPFPQAVAERLDRLKPHLRRAAQILRSQALYENREAMFKSAIDRAAVGMVFIDAKGAVVHANQTAVGILSEQDGLKVVNGQLTAMRDTEQHWLAELQQAALHGDRGSMSPREHYIERPSGKRPYSVLAVLFSEQPVWLLEGTSAILLIVGDPDSPQSTPRIALQTAYELTARETDLAVHLLSGESLKQIAILMGITDNTARSYLRNVFKKTRSSSQRELVRLLLSFPKA